MIPNDMADFFYANLNSIQNENKNRTIKFILITRNISFIAPFIFDFCKLVKCPRINKSGVVHIQENEKNKVQVLYDTMSINENIFHNIRANIYEIFTKNINTHNVIVYLCFKVIEFNELKNVDLFFNTLFKNLKFYNNNYRPIYHFENIIYNIRKLYA